MGPRCQRPGDCFDLLWGEEDQRRRLRLPPEFDAGDRVRRELEPPHAALDGVVEDRSDEVAVLVHVPGAHAAGGEGGQEFADLLGRNTSGRSIPECGHDPAIGGSLAAAMGRSRLGQEVAVISQGRRLAP
jgi:hypothetical protein